MSDHSTGESKDYAPPQVESNVLKRMPQALVEATQKLKIRLLFWAALVGILTGGVGTLFQIAVYQVIRGRAQLIQLVKDYAVLNWLVPTVLSAVMLYVTFLFMRRFAPETGGSGIPQIEKLKDFSTVSFPFDGRGFSPSSFLAECWPSAAAWSWAGRDRPSKWVGALARWWAVILRFPRSRSRL